MAQQLDYTIKLSINETEHILLETLGAEIGSPEGSVVRPISDFSRILSIEAQTVRRSFRALAVKGLVSVRSTTRADGSRDANEYRITLVGWEVLHSEGVPRRRRASGGRGAGK